MLDVLEWVKRAIADPSMTPLKKLLRRRDLPSEVRSSVKAYIEAEEDLRAHLKWNQAHSRKVSASRQCGDIPILTASNQDRWKDGNREHQYEQLREVIEEVGCPLKRELIARGFPDEEIRPRITFGLKLTPDGETLDVEPTAYELDFDPGDAVRWAAEFAAARRAECDRNGIWHPVFTLCGRVHGYFEENEAQEFRTLWSKKNPGWINPDVLLLDRVTVTLTATPSDQRWYDTLPPDEGREKMERDRKSIDEARARREAAAAPPAGPTYSAIFLDFAEGKDAPIRFQRGDQGRKSRAVDRETGEYVEWTLPHWQSPTSYYDLYSRDGTKICGATVEQKVIDLSGDGKAGLYKVRVLQMAQLLHDDRWSEITDASLPIAQKIARFIAALWLDAPARHSAEITFDLGTKDR